jgi:hypothetical protein
MLAALPQSILDIVSKKRIYCEGGQWWAEVDGATLGPFTFAEEARAEANHLVHRDLSVRAPASINQLPSFEEEIEQPKRVSQIFANTRQICWHGATVLARAEAQSLDDPKALAVVHYLIKHFHQFYQVANGVMVPSSSEPSRYYLVSGGACSCPARVARCKHQRAATLWLRCQVD